MKLQAFKTYQAVDFCNKLHTYFNPKVEGMKTLDVGFVEGSNYTMVYAKKEHNGINHSIVVPTGNLAYIQLEEDRTPVKVELAPSVDEKAASKEPVPRFSTK